MDTRILLFLFIVSSFWCCNARDLISAGSNKMISVQQSYTKLSGGETPHMEEVIKNETLCSLCEEFSADALNYLSENKTQTEIMDILHKTCVRIPTFHKQLEAVELLLKACNSIKNNFKKCKILVFEYAPVVLVNTEKFLETNDVCTILHACDEVGAQQSVIRSRTDTTLQSAS